MSEISSCPTCGMDNTYFDGVMNVCPDCGYEWNPDEVQETADVAKDSNGSVLQYGAPVTVIKGLTVNGS